MIIRGIRNFARYLWNDSALCRDSGVSAATRQLLGSKSDDFDRHGLTACVFV
jgi:hypothetical protein